MNENNPSLLANKDNKVARTLRTREGSLAAERNRLLVTFCISVLIIIVLLYKYFSLAEYAASNYKVAWVKLYPSGTWNVDFEDNNKALQVLPATVDSILDYWVERRFSKRPDSIQYDYGYVTHFLSTELYNKFIQKSEFSAAEKAAEIKSCNNCNIITYNPISIDHFDSAATTFGKTPGVLYRSNVFVERSSYSPGDGNATKDKRIVRIQWRLMSSLEIHKRVNKNKGKGKNKHKGREWLKVNPIGLVIIKYNEFDDTSDN